MDRPLNVRLYRTAWLAVLVPVLLAAFTITRPAPLPRSATVLEPAFDAAEAARTARELAALYPSRSPGSPGAAGAARWVQGRLAGLGLRTETERFTAVIPGRGRTELRNVSAVVPGRSLETILVIAHRDAVAGRAGLDDNASGTGALIELARALGTARTDMTTGASPNHTLRFVSTDAGAYGMLGARELAASSGGARTLAVIALDAIAGEGSPRIEIAGRGPRSPAPQLLATLTTRLAEEGGPHPRTASALGQLIDFAFPFALTEQLELLAADLPAVAISAGRTEGDEERLEGARLRQIGRAVEGAVASLDTSLAPPGGSQVYLHSRDRLIHGWAIALVYVAMLIPFAVALLDLLVRLRRRRVSLRPAVRSYVRRLAFWLWAGLVFTLFGLAGAWPDGDAAAISPDSQAADHWPRLGLALYALVLVTSWLVARARLVRRGPVNDEDAVAGIAMALAALGIVAIGTIVVNIYALLFVLPSAHAWLLSIHWRTRSGWLRAPLYATGLAGPALLLGSLAFRFGLGLDAPWYLAELTAIGYVPSVGFALLLAWAAVAAQVLAAITGRYAPYPAPPDRPVRGLIGTAVVSARRLRDGAVAGREQT